MSCKRAEKLRSGGRTIDARATDARMIDGWAGTGGEGRGGGGMKTVVRLKRAK